MKRWKKNWTSNTRENRNKKKYIYIERTRTHAWRKRIFFWKRSTKIQTSPRGDTRGAYDRAGMTSRRQLWFHNNITYVWVPARRDGFRFKETGAIDFEGNSRSSRVLYEYRDAPAHRNVPRIRYYVIILT